MPYRLYSPWFTVLLACSGAPTPLPATRGECGNGVAEPGEACDDGNAAREDGCDGCALARCGDGVMQSKPAACPEARCGNAATQAGAVEACDDGNDNDNDACVSCRLARCGDGWVRQVEPREECDAGDTLNGDGCSSSCRHETAHTVKLAPHQGHVRVTFKAPKPLWQMVVVDDANTAVTDKSGIFPVRPGMITVRLSNSQFSCKRPVGAGDVLDVTCDEVWSCSCS